MYPEEVADEIARCIGQCASEYTTPFLQIIPVGDEIDVQVENGEWFKVKVTKR